MSEAIPEAEAFLRFRLEEMSSRNEHHRFEEIAARVAHKRISANILVATGPVSAGGDQQRDAETFHTRIPDELPHATGFAASASTSPIVVACTVQRTGLRQKVRDDLAGICAEDAAAVEHVAFFSVHPISEGHTHELQRFARETYGVTLDIFCGDDIATQLAQPDLIWVARHYLELPSSMVPPPEGDPAPEWYTELLDKLRRNNGPSMLTPATQGEVTEGLRFATWDADANADIPEWLAFMRSFLSHTDEDEADGELAFRACYEIAVARFRGTGVAEDIEDLVRRALEYACTSDQPNIVDDAVTLASYWGVMWTTGVGRAEAAEIAAAQQRLRQHVSSLLIGTNPDTHPVRAASLTGTLAFSYLLPNWELAASSYGTPEPAERAPHVGVTLDDFEVNVGLLDPRYFTGLEQAMEQLDALIDLLPRAKPYSVRQLARVFNLVAPLTVEHPSYAKVRDGLDEATAAVRGDAATAEACRDRGTAFLEADQPLHALAELHTAKVKWFNGDTMYGAILTMRFIAQVYAELGLMYAAKMYGCAAATLALLSDDTDVKSQLPKALLESAGFAQRAGTWVDAAALTEVALLARAQFMVDGFDYDTNPDLAHHETNAALELAGIRSFWPEIEPLIAAAHPTTRWYEGLVELIETDGSTFDLSEDEFQDRATAQLGGPVLSDVGPSRIIDFTALGVRWTFTFDNDQTSVLTAEAAVAAFQVLLADIAHLHPVLIPATVHTTIDVVPGAERADDNIEIGESDSEVHAQITLTDDCADADARCQALMVIGFQLIQSAHVRPPGELQDLMEPLFRGGITHKIAIGRPYEETTRLFPPEHYTRLAEATRPASSDSFRPTDRPALAASTKRGPGYDEAASLRTIRERYEVANDALRYTLPRILADAHGRAQIERLRADGWLDWQILVTFLNAALNWKMQVAGMTPDHHDNAALMRLGRAPETADSPEIPLSVFDADNLELHFFMQTVTVARRWNIRGRNEGKEEGALRDLLTRRYRYAVDDVPHRDLLDCVDADGALLPLLDINE
ncbi:hypothetical protein IEZ26_15895 [Nocardioides cavernae]|uniref:UvrC family homology region profile domain-containing protein n=1 Tax=Nocardioides cavernae TaxID=1921566 RepID=A0ABR8NEV4_9ACTN|nr:hypothetical protein [Nocardioides cavernae]MBD3926107.1 hypothetical protein [Nocardioides cavernae]MBM7513696.1 hypothetical protein [Nocardioides cavernae]